MTRLVTGWIGWLGLAAAAIIVVRLLTGWALPLLPEAYAWSSSAVLGFAIMLMFRTPPSERRG